MLDVSIVLLIGIYTDNILFVLITNSVKAALALILVFWYNHVFPCMECYNSCCSKNLREHLNLTSDLEELKSQFEKLY